MPRTPQLRLCLVLFSLLALGPAGAAFDEDGYVEAIETIRCDCGCHPQSLKDCACGHAAEMREKVRAEMAGEADGKERTGEELIAEYVAEHGEQIRISPTATGFNLVAWLGPLLGLGAACIGMLFLLRRWNRPGELVVDAVPGGAAAPALSADDPYMARLQRDVEEME